jgi:hypothetical protein
MLPSSVAIVVATALFTLGAAALLFWAWRRGFLRDIDAQSRVIFDPRDMRVARPWETPVQRLRREAAFGDLVPATPGEWGGATGPDIGREAARDAAPEGRA